MPEIQKSLDAEQAAFDQEVAEIEAWWSSSEKQKQLKRCVEDNSMRSAESGNC